MKFNLLNSPHNSSFSNNHDYQTKIMSCSSIFNSSKSLLLLTKPALFQNKLLYHLHPRHPSCCTFSSVYPPLSFAVLFSSYVKGLLLCCICFPESVKSNLFICEYRFLSPILCPRRRSASEGLYWLFPILINPPLTSALMFTVSEASFILCRFFNTSLLSYSKALCFQEWLFPSIICFVKAPFSSSSIGLGMLGVGVFSSLHTSLWRFHSKVRP